MSVRSRVVDTVFGGVELLVALYDWVRGLRKPGPKHDGDTDPFILRAPPRNAEKSQRR